MEVKIRKATLSDLESILKLNLLLFREDYKRDKTLNLSWSYSNEGKSFYKDMIIKLDNCALVAEHRGKVIGYIVGCLKEEEIRIKAKYAELEDMLVLPKLRSQGIGGRLLKEFLSWCQQKGVNYVDVKVTIKNQRAVDFYKKRGFEDYITTLEKKLS